MCKCKLDIYVTEDVNYTLNTYLHRNNIAHLVSDYVYVLYISAYIQVGEIPCAVPSCPPPSRHYPFHTRLSPPIRGLKFRQGN